MRIRIVLRCAYLNGQGSVGDQADFSFAAAVRFWTT